MKGFGGGGMAMGSAGAAPRIGAVGGCSGSVTPGSAGKSIII